MSRRLIDFETLNAYVDGELDAAAAAEVARAVAEDRALARELAALSRLRSTVAESFEAPPLSIPASPPTGDRRIFVAAAAALIAFVAGSILVANLGDRASASWLARAWEVHHGWSIDKVAAKPRSALLFADYEKSVPGAYVPDLSASRLTLVHAALAPFTRKRNVLVAGYRGTRGCKISLLIFPSPEALGESMARFHDGTNEAYGWRAGRLGYFILSDGMDSDRFRLLAASVRDTSRKHLPFDVETRLALRESRDESEPCRA